jgi:diguanylate cyclase (GGDEF)-like protein
MMDSDEPFNDFYNLWTVNIAISLETLLQRNIVRSLVADLEVQSTHDRLTGMLNRRGFEERSDRVFRQLLSDRENVLTAVMIDMDRLKYINDTFGHKEGDFGIKTICNVLRETSLENEICVRSGGDEFFLIGIGKYKKDDESQRALNFVETLKKRSEELQRSYNISASIGCVVYDDYNEVALDNALSEADERMYHYKFRNRRHRSV